MKKPARDSNPLTPRINNPVMKRILAVSKHATTAVRPTDSEYESAYSLFNLTAR
jgi:hypothetical protein